MCLPFLLSVDIDIPAYSLFFGVARLLNINLNVKTLTCPVGLMSIDNLIYTFDTSVCLDTQCDNSYADNSDNSDN